VSEPRDEWDALWYLFRILDDQSVRFAVLKDIVTTSLDDSEYDELKRRLDAAHAAVESAADEARRVVDADEVEEFTPARWNRYSEVRLFRKERGLTQWALARLSGVSRATIHRVEMGQQQPRLDTIYKLARALKVDAWEIEPMIYRMEDEAVGVKMTPGLQKRLMPVVEAVARRYALNPSDVDDLVGAGLEGMVEACRKFDPERGTPLDWFARFYAVNRVRDEARRLYRNHPGFGLENQGVEPWHYG
jgi:transcriptional regulator with XRE-family HTH domain